MAPIATTNDPKLAQAGEDALNGRSDASYYSNRKYRSLSGCNRESLRTYLVQQQQPQLGCRQGRLRSQ